MINIDPTIRDLIERLQIQYCTALDNKNMQSWYNAFAEDENASYTCITKESVENDLSLAMMLDDCQARLKDRVTIVDDIWAGTFQDYRTRHFTQLVAADKNNDDLVDARTNFQVLYTPDETGITEVLTAGVYEDRIVVPKSGDARFLTRKAVLDTNVLPRYLVYPI